MSIERMCVSRSDIYVEIPNHPEFIYDILNKSNVRLKVLDNGKIIGSFFDLDLKCLIKF